MARSKRRAGTLPNRKVGPGCVFQEVGRSHQTSIQSIKAMVAIKFSSALSERSWTGIRKKRAMTAILPTIGASPNNQVSRRLKDVLAIERHMYEPSRAMQIAAFTLPGMDEPGSMFNAFIVIFTVIKKAQIHPKMPPIRTQLERATTTRASQQILLNMTYTWNIHHPA